MASEFRFIDDEIWLGYRCVARLRHYLPYVVIILELVGVFCLQLGAVGGRENGCKTVFGRCRQDEGCQTGANECDRGDEGSGADHGCLVGGLSR